MTRRNPIPATGDPGPPRRLSILTALGLVLLCEGIALFAFFKKGFCLTEGQPTISKACASATAGQWYERSLIVAAVIAAIGMGAASFRRSPRLAWLTVTLSLALTTATMVWGLQEVRSY